MARETMVPLSAVLALIERQEAFNTQLIDKLGLFLVQAAEKYDAALNPPVHQPSGEEMSFTRLSEEEEDLQFQLESGLISVDQYTPAMKRILADTKLSLEP